MVFILPGEAGGLRRPTAWKADLEVLVGEDEVEEVGEEEMYGENLELFTLSRPGLAEVRLA